MTAPPVRTCDMSGRPSNSTISRTGMCSALATERLSFVLNLASCELVDHIEITELHRFHALVDGERAEDDKDRPSLPARQRLLVVVAPWRERPRVGDGTTERHLHLTHFRPCAHGILSRHSITR